MSWSSPFLSNKVNSLAGIAKGMEFGLQLEKDGLEWGSDEWREAVAAYLSSPAEGYCRCGRRLVIVDSGSGICTPCREALVESEERKKAGDHRLAQMERLGIPPAYQHCTFETFRGEIPEGIAAWCVKPTPTLVIYGNSTGTGKTHLATAALYSMHNSGRRCFWASSVVLAKRMHDERFADVRETEKRSAKVEVLLLDDYGKEDGVIHNARELISSLLDERHAYKRPTILTTNLTPEQMMAYDARLASRLLSSATEEREGEDERWKAPLLPPEARP